MRRWYWAVAACAAAAIPVGGGAGASGRLIAHAALPSGDKIYFGENGGTQISQAALNDSGGSDVTTVTVESILQETGTALDPANNRIYWVSYESDQIWSANLDGTGGAELLYQGTAEDVDGPNGIAIDPATNKIYWSNIGNYTLAEANLDGSGGEQLLNTTGVTVTNPQGLAIDPAANKIFWGNSNQIAETNLDDTGNASYLDLTGATANQIVGVAIDPATNKIYWSNAGAPDISYANLDGTGDGGDLDISGATAPSGATGVAIDPADNRIYWASKVGNKISYANLDDTGQGGDLNTTGATVNAPNYPAILKAPTGTGAPTLTGGTAADSKLSCGQGTWEADLPGGQLYQAPQTYTYSWTRDGSTVSGATKSTLIASSGGTYSCAVTGTNDAGSATQPSTTTITVSSPPGSTGAPGCTLKPKGTTQTVTATSHALKLTARCTQTVSGKLNGSVTVVPRHGKRRTFKLGQLSPSLRAGSSVTLSVRLPKAALKAVQGAKAAFASFNLKATNSNGTALAGAKVAHVTFKHKA